MCTLAQTDSQWVASSLGLVVFGHSTHLLILTRGTLVVSPVSHLIPFVSLHRCIPLRPAHLIQASSFQAASSHSRCCPAWASIFLPCLCLCCLGDRCCPACAWGTLRLDARWPLRRPEVLRSLVAWIDILCCYRARDEVRSKNKQSNCKRNERCGTQSICHVGCCGGVWQLFVSRHLFCRGPATCICQAPSFKSSRPEHNPPRSRQTVYPSTP